MRRATCASMRPRARFPRSRSPERQKLHILMCFGSQPTLMIPVLKWATIPFPETACSVLRNRMDSARLTLADSTEGARNRIPDGCEQGNCKPIFSQARAVSRIDCRGSRKSLRCLSLRQGALAKGRWADSRRKPQRHRERRFRRQPLRQRTARAAYEEFFAAGPGNCRTRSVSVDGCGGRPSGSAIRERRRCGKGKRAGGQSASARRPCGEVSGCPRVEACADGAGAAECENIGCRSGTCAASRGARGDETQCGRCSSAVGGNSNLAAARTHGSYDARFRPRDGAHHCAGA